MQITFLGTGAASAVPLPFCTCSLCQAARRLGAKELRARSALLVNDDLMIDFGPDAVPAAQRMGKDLTRVRTLLITHAHRDHFDPGHLVTRLSEYGCPPAPPLVLAASPATLAQLSVWLEAEETGTSLQTKRGCERLGLTVRPLAAGQSFGADRYTITGLYSHHAPGCDSRMYLVDDGHNALLYAVDTPAFEQDVWDALEQTGCSFSCVVIDHTYGIAPPDVQQLALDHMDAQQVEQTANELRERGLLRTGAAVYATHLSHEWMLPHEQMTCYARAHGYEIAWDGLMLTL